MVLYLPSQRSESLTVHRRCTQHRIQVVSFASLEPVSVQSVSFFLVSDRWLPRRSSLERLPHSFDDSPSSPLIHMHLDLFFIHRSPVALIHVHFLYSFPYSLRDSLQRALECMPIVRIIRMRPRTHHPHSSTAHSHTHFHSKLVSLLRLAFALG